MKMILPVIVLGLGLSIGVAKEKPWPKKGSKIYISSDYQIQFRANDPNVIVPHERLDCNGGPFCVYLYKPCEELVVKGTMRLKKIRYLTICTSKYFGACLVRNDQSLSEFHETSEACFENLGNKEDKKNHL